MLLVLLLLTARATTPDAVLAGLKSVDDAPCTVQLTLTRAAVPADPSQGRLSQQCTAHFSSSEVATRCTSTYGTDPTFHPKGDSKAYSDIDYSSDGRLVLWRLDSSLAFVGPERSLYLRVVAKHAVGPGFHSGAPAPDVPILYISSPGSDDAYPYVRQARLALGRGFSDYITEVTTVAEHQGSIDVRATGTYGSAGTWQLTIREEGWLVTRATFVQGDAETITISNDLDNGRRPYASTGRIHREAPIDLDITAELTGWTQGADAAATRAVLADIERVTPTQTIDLRPSR